MSEMERELGWEDEIEKDGGDFILLPAGDYNFTVEKFERGRFQGSAKMPACNQAKLTLTVHSPEHGDVTVFDKLLLHTKTEGFLSSFFAGIGQKKKGERLRMNWNAVIGAKGRVKLEINKFIGNDGEEKTNNQVKTYLPFEDYLKHQVQGQPPQQQQQNYQQQQTPQQNNPAQGYGQTQNQPPFPTQNQQQSPQQGQSGGFTPGTF